MPPLEPGAPVCAPAAPSKKKPAGVAGRPGRLTGEATRTYRIPWAELLKKVFEIDVLACPECGGRMKLIAYIAEPTIAKRILDHLRLDSTGPPLATARSGQAHSVDPAPADDVADTL